MQFVSRKKIMWWEKGKDADISYTRQLNSVLYFQLLFRVGSFRTLPWALGYICTKAKVSKFMNVTGFITFRVFGFARRLHYRGFVGIQIQCFHFKFRIQKFLDSWRNRKVLIPDSRFVCKRQTECGTKTFRIRNICSSVQRGLRELGIMALGFSDQDKHW